MPNFQKHLGKLIGWLAVSELLCLILAFSFAIIGGTVAKYLGLILGLTAHILLMRNAAHSAADACVIYYRKDKIRVSSRFIVALGILSAIPHYLLYVWLLICSDSIAVRNVFPLLEAMYLQIFQLIFGNTETVSALSFSGKCLTALPQFCTPIVVICSFGNRYESSIAAEDANSCKV